MIKGIGRPSKVIISGYEDEIDSLKSQDAKATLSSANSGFLQIGVDPWNPRGCEHSCD